MRGNNRAEVTMRRSKKTTQILLIIAGLFGIHWLPFHILTIGIKSDVNEKKKNLHHLTAGGS